MAQQHIVVIGGGTAGLGVIASLRKRRQQLTITLIEPQEYHYYQPGWTLVGAGEYDQLKTRRPLRELIPEGVCWCQDRVSKVDAESQQVHTLQGQTLTYDVLLICCGLTLHWEKIDGLTETLGKNGVTSNYRYDLAPYTWQLVQQLQQGNALFTQPPVPIKCAGAPQKALYLACDYWQKQQRLEHIQSEFCLAGQQLFSVSAFIPELERWMARYHVRINYGCNLVKVDGANHQAWFELTGPEGVRVQVQKSFDMLHVVPPQLPPAFIASSGLGNEGGWCEVDEKTLQHKRFPSVFALGDVVSSPNSKTAAAARKQIVIVARNVLHFLRQQSLTANYDGYSSCPLSVARGKVVLAEFGYNGRLLPTFPLNPLKPHWLGWFLKTRFLPWFYWKGLLQGVEWFTYSKPKR
ncbi:pyridine nucleotide-disulfide oxidoreductase [Erwinia sp. OLTSP20]|uniref:NAD(P)/FAD-dependent oxidoreductase n=1 Tax=unclassified Erwinia TaxID=2622719 RepID=UPI000C1A0B52|nr:MULTISPECIES: FAD/NAD(P)-binding oxidoreductase [unclassified Erwinia]PIJ50438.1 pyridine nucleotide-disulfide oxidoreductase [Erwinia sp. OAMSP11]PIJ72509.1 pyridine nucleotide-disulfide oxidoreductase [Erwinia sp. OLSSP12]PIJ81747.1 pyridine nucleotide-disulfide oxidoreductase [Erwinia sp. OLCASP19]PIJ84340.1 pyridine nucleotide-disulfide oxidoreductase [Erwinia sp. OLMTSP26]PIJ86204.1 pyridine nucleotide-disulfide oxidoreductase [Erwinia sp. OLMDSP33]